MKDAPHDPLPPPIYGTRGEEFQIEEPEPEPLRPWIVRGALVIGAIVLLVWLLV